MGMASDESVHNPPRTARSATIVAFVIIPLRLPIMMPAERSMAQSSDARLSSTPVGLLAAIVKEPRLSS
jgi:hypothetical protein